MGTRCLTRFIDERSGEDICVLYRQYDGYVEGHGRELVQFLAERRVVNGYTSADRERGWFNGMSCLAASVISHFKEKIGDFYLYPPNTEGLCEEYTYTIYIPVSEMENGDTFSWVDDEGERGAKIYLRIQDYGGDVLHDACVDQLSVLLDAPSVQYDADIEDVVRQSMAFRMAVEEWVNRMTNENENGDEEE
tara:strand:- start:13400 stop:13975 length:576 start_codon:yes stop_codon:yes gene_type:complete